jgi:hypothetical protein
VVVVCHQLVQLASRTNFFLYYIVRPPNGGGAGMLRPQNALSYFARARLLYFKHFIQRKIDPYVNEGRTLAWLALDGRAFGI